MNRKRKFLFLFSGLTILMTPVITTALISVAYLPAIIYSAVCLFISYLLYWRYIKGVRPKYPLASPVKDQDIYFPRSNIPRPVYQDYREHPEFFEKKKKKAPRFSSKTPQPQNRLYCLFFYVNMTHLERKIRVLGERFTNRYPLIFPTVQS